jgi:hypothetical protein
MCAYRINYRNINNIHYNKYLYCINIRGTKQQKPGENIKGEQTLETNEYGRTKQIQQYFMIETQSTMN